MKLAVERTSKQKEDAFSVWLYSRVYCVLTDAVVDLEAAAIATSSQGRE